MPCRYTPAIGAVRRSVESPGTMGPMNSGRFYSYHPLSGVRTQKVRLIVSRDPLFKYVHITLGNVHCYLVTNARACVRRKHATAFCNGLIIVCARFSEFLD